MEALVDRIPRMQFLLLAIVSGAFPNRLPIPGLLLNILLLLIPLSVLYVLQLFYMILWDPLSWNVCVSVNIYRYAYLWKYTNAYTHTWSDLVDLKVEFGVTAIAFFLSMSPYCLSKSLPFITSAQAAHCLSALIKDRAKKQLREGGWGSECHWLVSSWSPATGLWVAYQQHSRVMGEGCPTFFWQGKLHEWWKSSERI